MKPAITVVAIVLCILFALGMYVSSANREAEHETHAAAKKAAAADRHDNAEPEQRPGAAAEDPAAPAMTLDDDPASASADASTGPDEPSNASVAEPADAQPPVNLATLATPLRVRPAHVKETRVLGSDDAESGYKLRLELTSWGAGVKRITLADYDTAVDNDVPYLIMHQLDAPEGQSVPTKSPFAARAVTINGNRIPLESVQWAPGEKQQTDAGEAVTYSAVIEDANQQPVLRITRTYRLARDGYGVQLEQHLENLTPAGLRVRWKQNIQGDLNQDPGAYLGDRRTYAAGYFNTDYDPGKFGISIKDSLLYRKTVIERSGIWPNPDLTGNVQLAWIASENRYFAVGTHAALPPGIEKTAQVPPLEDRFSDYGADIFPQGANVKEQDKSMVFTVATPPATLKAGDSEDLSLGFFAGPRKNQVFAAQPYSALHFDELVRYELGCTMCTFQWLARGLLDFLKFVHWLTADWAIAIIVLVALVRLLLHPITKRAQANMMKMGKQMQSLQPEMEKLKKKYKDDQTALNREMMKLYKEKGVNPANALGCLPMFLQMPIWVALYAMLYFAIELRHEPAFWGFFQLFNGWSFLADLSSPDNFIKLFDHPVPVHLLFINLNFQAINIFPLLMAVVFYFQQKFTTPPAANEQGAQQQKIMKFMVLLFPLFLYGAPAGLTLYILTSTTAGVIDSYLVRKHVQQQEESGELFKKKPRKPGGLMDRVQKYAQSKQAQMQAIQEKQQQGKVSQSTKTRKGKKR